MHFMSVDGGMKKMVENMAQSVWNMDSVTREAVPSFYAGVPL